jgi:hypothetical protein
MTADFFHVCADVPPLLASLGEALSAREKALVKVDVVDIDVGRLDGCRTGGAAVPAATSGAPWC